MSLKVEGTCKLVSIYTGNGTRGAWAMGRVTMETGREYQGKPVLEYMNIVISGDKATKLAALPTTGKAPQGNGNLVEPITVTIKGTLANPTRRDKQTRRSIKDTLGMFVTDPKIDIEEISLAKTASGSMF